MTSKELGARATSPTGVVSASVMRERADPHPPHYMSAIVTQFPFNHSDAPTAHHDWNKIDGIATVVWLVIVVTRSICDW